MWRHVSIVVLALIASGCASTPPTGWTTGGQPMVTPRERWVNVEILVDMDLRGRVFVGGRHLLTIDRAGRIYNAQNEPVALLQRDGMLIGAEDEPMGWVGAGEAIQPGDEHSWLILQEGGLLLRSDGDQARPFGQWLGCSYVHTVQTCTLVSHIIGREILAKRGEGDGLGLTPGLSIGLGTTFIAP
jgi:hypothetical protein